MRRHFTSSAINRRSQTARLKMIGKRKRDTSVVSRSTKADEQEQETSTPTTPTDVSHDLFRKFFESQFEPLDVPGIQVSRAPESEEDNDDGESEESEVESEWDGITGDGDEGKVEVVEHQDSSTKTDGLLDKKARKSFMVCVYTQMRQGKKWWTNGKNRCRTRNHHHLTPT